MTSIQSTPQSGDSAAARRTGMAGVTLRYTLMRFGLFGACFVVLATLAWLGVIPAGIGTSNPLWLLALSILISAPLSLVLLRKQRDAMSERLAPRMDRASASFKKRLNANQGREDEVA
ncbi:DUF4229 domain-containing protein [Streptomyces durbertensis]|nr:DUF4229 domain-containing protein [Streptomyces durbertensis]